MDTQTPNTMRVTNNITRLATNSSPGQRHLRRKATLNKQKPYNGAAPPNMGILVRVTEPTGAEESQSIPIEPDGIYRIDPVPAGSAEFWFSWNREPNTVTLRPVDIALPIGQGEVLRKDFVFEGPNEDIEQGFWDAEYAR